jgi:hypothetical protein
MISSLDEAMSLLKKWKHDRSSIAVAFFSGPHKAPRSVEFHILGRVTKASRALVEISTDDDLYWFRFDRPGTSFEYMEPGDRELAWKGTRRELAAGLAGGFLYVEWDDGCCCILAPLREGNEPG